MDADVAARRNCFVGAETWLGTYAKDDLWGCRGLGFSGRWRDQPAEQYITTEQSYLTQRVWETSGLKAGWPSRARFLRARRVHDHGHAHETDRRAGKIEAIGPIAVENTPPRERPHDEDAAIGREDATEIGIRLQGRDESIHTQHHDAGADPCDAPVFTDALPDQPRATDLGDGRGDEQRNRSKCVHLRDVDGQVLHADDDNAHSRDLRGLVQDGM